jgi:6-phosphogluconolactonase
MALHIFKNKDALTRATAEWITELIEEKLKRQSRFTWCLSGGSTPKQLYSLLHVEPFRSRIDWSKLHIFFGDERAVPFEDERNNGKMASDNLLDNVPIPLDQIHFMKTDIDPMMSAIEYENLLHQYFDKSTFTFDLVLLGMGDDAHTLSIFPGSSLVNEKEKWATSVYVPSQQMDRITLTPGVVNESEKIMFLIAGDSKASALKQVKEGPYDPMKYPSQLIQPTKGELHWFIDEAAAKEL